MAIVGVDVKAGRIAQLKREVQLLALGLYGVAAVLLALVALVALGLAAAYFGFRALGRLVS